MNTKKSIYPLITPIMGMLPVVVFFLSAFFLPYNGALLASLLVFAASFLIGAVFVKQAPPYTINLSAIAFLMLVVLSFIKPFGEIYEKASSVILEVWVVLVFSVFCLVRDFFRGRILIKNSPNKDFLLVSFDANIYVIRVARYILASHLLIVLLYSLFPEEYKTPAANDIVYFVILYFLVLVHFVYEFVRFNKLKTKIVTEEWLPIVNEHGGVQGKVAWSISKNLGDKYLHPVIRIALVHKGMLYLQERPEYFISQKGRLDHPFETYLHFGETLDDGIKRSFVEKGITEELKTRYIFRYTYKSIETNRLIYLYACNVPQESMVKSLDLGDGKFWTSKQIEENMGSGLFSDCFEKEYELLDNTVLMADKLMNNLLVEQ